MRLNGIGDVIFRPGENGQARIDYDALIAIIERSSPVRHTDVDGDAIRDGYLPAGRFDYATYRDIWEAIVRERGTDDAWKIIYGLMRICSGQMIIGSVNCRI